MPPSSGLLLAARGILARWTAVALTAALFPLVRAEAAVLTVAPAFDGRVTDVTPKDGTFDNATRVGLDIQVHNNFFESRGILEFPTSAIPAGATINSVRFVFETTARADTATEIVNLIGYVGDGAISTEDATAAGTALGSYDSYALGMGPQSVALDAAAYEALRTGRAYVGLRMQGGNGIATAIASTEYDDFAVPPHLVIDYTPVPEPTGLAAATIGSAALALRRRRRQTGGGGGSGAPRGSPV